MAKTETTSGAYTRRARALTGATGLFALLMLLGLVLQSVSGKLFWGGWIALAGFYAAMFGIGLVAARRDDRQIQELLLAGRTLPLGIALLTMTATWVGGGFINGTAESAYASGLAWAQAPWGYALSLVVGGLIFARPMRRRNYTTMLDPLADRYGQPMAAVLYVPALLGEIFWTAAILTALGTTFGFILGINVPACDHCQCFDRNCVHLAGWVEGGCDDGHSATGNSDGRTVDRRAVHFTRRRYQRADRRLPQNNA